MNAGSNAMTNTMVLTVSARRTALWKWQKTTFEQADNGKGEPNEVEGLRWQQQRTNTLKITT